MDWNRDGKVDSRDTVDYFAMTKSSEKPTTSVTPRKLPKSDKSSCYTSGKSTEKQNMQSYPTLDGTRYVLFMLFFVIAMIIIIGIPALRVSGIIP